MRTIWKLTLSVGVNGFELPVGAKLLSVAMQNDAIMLWAEVKSDARRTTRRVTVVGTGWDMQHLGDAIFVGTVIQGPFVWHVFAGGDE